MRSTHGFMITEVNIMDNGSPCGIPHRLRYFSPRPPAMELYMAKSSWKLRYAEILLSDITAALASIVSRMLCGMPLLCCETALRKPRKQRHADIVGGAGSEGVRASRRLYDAVWSTAVIVWPMQLSPLFLVDLPHLAREPW